DPHALSLAGEVLFNRISSLGAIEAVGGLTSGADPLIVATSLHAVKQGKMLPGFFVRDAQKSHGTEREIEGIVVPDMKVVMLDDVITKGNSVLKAIRPVEKVGAKIERILILVDREEGGINFLADQGYRAEAIFTVGELRACGAVPHE